MRIKLSFFLVCLTFCFGSLVAQGVSCPNVTAPPDTSIVCGGCLELVAIPEAGYQTTDYTTQQIQYSPYPYNQGTSILLNIDDTWSSVLPLGFDFCFYGNTYDQCVIGSNGLITFDLAQAGQYCQWPINDPIPSPNNPMNSIMGPFHDIDPGVTGTIRWDQFGVAPCRVFVVSFESIAMFDCNNLIATQQIVLYEGTNIIETYMENKPLCSSWNDGTAIHGIQDATGTNAVVVPGRNYPTQWQATNDAWRFVPAGAPNYMVSWFANGAPVGSGDTLVACPSGNTEYVVQVDYTCGPNVVSVFDTTQVNFTAGTLVVNASGTDVSCSGGSDGTASVTFTGGTPGFNTIEWNTIPIQTTASVTGLTAGTYTVTVFDSTGCSAAAQVVIGETSPMTLTTASSDLLCFEDGSGTGSVSVAGGTAPYTYAWDNNATSASQNTLDAGTYSITVTDAGGCISTTSITVNEPPLLEVQVDSTDVRCHNENNGTLTATIAGGTLPYALNWSIPAFGQVLNNLGPGNYALTVTDANGCIESDVASIRNPDPMSLVISGDDEVCKGFPTTLNSDVNGGTVPYHYQWVSIPNSVNDTNASTTHAPSADSDYVLSVVDDRGCTVQDRFSVVVHPNPDVAFEPSIREGCDELEVSFTNNTQDADTYVWIFGDGSTSAEFEPTHVYGNGNFSVTLNAYNQFGCYNGLIRSPLIEVIPTPTAGFVSRPGLTDEPVCLPEATFWLNSTSENANAIYWDFGNGDTEIAGDVTYTYLDTGRYTITMIAENKFGCTDTIDDGVWILPVPEFYIPNAFTPNGDQLNDEFLIMGLEIVDYNIEIFDRYGKLIFVSESMGESWNGEFGGQPAPEGVYVWKARAVNNKGETWNRKGTVTLIR